MKLVRFQRHRYTSLGVLQDDGRIVDLSAAAAAWLCLEQGDPMWEQEVALRLPPDIGKFLGAGRPSEDLARAALAFASRQPTPLGIGGEPLFVASNEVRLLAPLTAPLILSDGATVREPGNHREFFMRNPLNLLGPADEISLPGRLSREFDLVPRLVAIIGKPVRNASRAEAEEAIGGWGVGIDVCARDLEIISWAGPMFHVQYPHAHAFDGSFLLGAPVVANADASMLGDCTARLTVDKTCVFEGPLAHPADVLLEWICYLSETVTLEPGTLLIKAADDETVLQRSNAADRPVELVNLRPSQRGLLKPGATVVLDVPTIGRIATRISENAEPVLPGH